ncbi:hypothetical protein QBC42DRAFT_349592 [Cladorrhinum samala]|uniref:Uncharacterized protein n=1 Tax=Cladorrhinum samala TaxID=585594 RepID=A0AAV9HGA9_9PEZI|nr:hypothetical protein QBC42DRAFT_349592 [Cladorrhinum samala]
MATLFPTVFEASRQAESNTKDYEAATEMTEMMLVARTSDDTEKDPNRGGSASRVAPASRIDEEDRPLGTRGVKSENVTPIRAASSKRFNSVLARFETGVFPPLSAREPFAPAIPSYYSTHSLPIASARQSRDSGPAPVIPEAQNVSPYQHRAFSFESPPASPRLSILPNQGGLELATLSSQNDLPMSEYGDSNEALHQPNPRSTSSSYPSEGIRSPDMTVSPPMTFGRRILSGLSGLGFSSAHLSFLDSEEDESKREPSGAESRQLSPETKSTEIHKPVDSHHAITTSNISQHLLPLYPGENKLPSAEAAIVAAIPQLTIPRPITCPPRVDRSSSIRSIISAPSQTNDDILEDINLSTQCLPRLSANLSISAAQRPSIDLSHRFSFSASLKSKISGHFRRNLNHAQSLDHGRSRCIDNHRPIRVIKVKKWIVRQFRAGRKGSRVIVMKMRRLAGKNDNKQKRVIAKAQKQGKKSEKRVRARLLHVIGDVKRKEKGREEKNEMPDVAAT